MDTNYEVCTKHANYQFSRQIHPDELPVQGSRTKQLIDLSGEPTRKWKKVQRRGGVIRFVVFSSCIHGECGFMHLVVPLGLDPRTSERWLIV